MRNTVQGVEPLEIRFHAKEFQFKYNSKFEIQLKWNFNTNTVAGSVVLSNGMEGTIGKFIFLLNKLIHVLTILLSSFWRCCAHDY